MSCNYVLQKAIVFHDADTDINSDSDSDSPDTSIHSYEDTREEVSEDVAFHNTDTDTRMSACRSACYRKSRVSDVSARILAGMSVSVSVSASWNSSYTRRAT